MLMLGASRPGALAPYEALIRGLSARLPDSWGVVARADDLMRSENWERARHELGNDRRVSQHRCSFDPARKLEAVIVRSIQDTQ